MTFGAAMDYIHSVSKKGSVLGLHTTRELLKRVGNPQEKLKFVHIAGTNGKGSALAYISTILSVAGYRTGRYLSPVIYSYNEKIQVDEEAISNEAIARLTGQLKEACDAMVADGFEQPTVFEIETAMAFLYLLQEQCDIAVIETGMGGRDDATNVIPSPLCSVIMSVSLDHVGVIGKDLTEIAECKAGIIKEHSNVVLYHQSDPVTDIVKKRCNKQHAKLVITDPQNVFIKEESLDGQVFDYDGFKDVTIRLLGEHQIHNACVAMEVMRVLRTCGMAILDEDIRKGMEGTRWPGRFEVVRRRPLIIMDGAHNPDGALSLKNSMERYLDGYTKIFVMGVLRDKDYETMIKLTNSLASAIITINPDNERALSDEELKDAVNHWKTKEIPVLAAGRIESGVELASQIAMQLDAEHTAIVVFGSLSFLGDLGRYLYR